MLSVDFSARKGAFLLQPRFEARDELAVIIGASGSGKSLTLKAIAGLLTPDSGEIILPDGAVAFRSSGKIDMEPQRRSVGYVVQDLALFPHLTVRQNIAFALDGRPRAEAQRRTDELIALLGLEGTADRRPGAISGGQQQRVALARALATDPDVLLLDEPFSALDAPLRRELSSELGQTLREWGKIAVLVTHDLPEAYQIADTVVLYEHGGTTPAVSKNDLLWNPSSERVARLIGARNILRATIADSSGESIVLDWRGGRLEAARSPSHQLHARPGDQLAFFVRPEYVRLIRKNRQVTDLLRQTNLFHGEIVGERDEGTTWALFFRLSRPGQPSQGNYDLEIEIPKLVYERLGISTDRHWDVSIHPGSIQVLPAR